MLNRKLAIILLYFNWLEFLFFSLSLSRFFSPFQRSIFFSVFLSQHKKLYRGKFLCVSKRTEYRTKRERRNAVCIVANDYDTRLKPNKKYVFFRLLFALLWERNVYIWFFCACNMMSVCCQTLYQCTHGYTRSEALSFSVALTIHSKTAQITTKLHRTRYIAICTLYNNNSKNRTQNWIYYTNSEPKWSNCMLRTVLYRCKKREKNCFKSIILCK